MSSSSPSKDWSKIPHPINNPSGSNNTFRPWKMSEEIKKEVHAKEEELETHSQSIRARRLAMDRKEEEIGKKMKWIKQTKLQIKEKEQMIKESKKSVMWAEKDLMLDVKEMNKKQAWVNIEKKKFPLDYPEIQTENH